MLSNNKSQEIEIKIEEIGKECVKKLFKRVHKLTEDLAKCEKEKALLELELKNLKSVPRTGNDELLKRLEIENHKLKLEV